ncbi:MAG: hypothetical protein AB7D06_04590 [Pedobacter sp.]
MRKNFAIFPVSLLLKIKNEKKHMAAVAHQKRMAMFETTPKKGEELVMSAGSLVNMAIGVPLWLLTKKTVSSSSQQGMYRLKSNLTDAGSFNMGNFMTALIEKDCHHCMVSLPWLVSWDPVMHRI